MACYPPLLADEGTRINVCSLIALRDMALRSEHRGGGSGKLSGRALQAHDDWLAAQRKRNHATSLASVRGPAIPTPTPDAHEIERALHDVMQHRARARSPDGTSPSKRLEDSAVLRRARRGKKVPHVEDPRSGETPHERALSTAELENVSTAKGVMRAKCEIHEARVCLESGQKTLSGSDCTWGFASIGAWIDAGLPIAQQLLLYSQAVDEHLDWSFVALPTSVAGGTTSPHTPRHSESHYPDGRESSTPRTGDASGYHGKSAPPMNAQSATSKYFGFLRSLGHPASATGQHK